MPESGFVRQLEWMRKGSALLNSRLDASGEQAATGDSALPGWTRAHVLTHLARNADALVNLLTWARTGVETPMYADMSARSDDIERGAKRNAAEVLADYRESAGRLRDATAELPAASWNATVRSALGRTIPASEVPWMRTREVWIHLIDLGLGDDFDAFPADLVDALLSDASAGVGRKEGCPPVVLRPDDRDRSWRVGPAAAETDDAADEVRGSAAALCGWLVGRETPATRGVAAETAVLPAWL